MGFCTVLGLLVTGDIVRGLSQSSSAWASQDEFTLAMTLPDGIYTELIAVGNGTDGLLMLQANNALPGTAGEQHAPSRGFSAELEGLKKVERWC